MSFLSGWGGWMSGLMTSTPTNANATQENSTGRSSNEADPAESYFKTVSGLNALVHSGTISDAAELKLTKTEKEKGDQGEITHETSKPTGLGIYRGFRAMVRTRKEQNDYRRGMERIRKMVGEQFDQHAVRRFDKHFSYRYYSGKPLTMGALRIFIKKEEELRKDSFNITKEVKRFAKSADQLEGKDKWQDNLRQLAKDLLPEQETKMVDEEVVIEDQKKDSAFDSEKTSNQKDIDTFAIIGSTDEVVTEPKKYSFPFIPIYYASFASSADLEESKHIREDGIKVAREVIESAFEGHDQNEKELKLKDFDEKFGAEIKIKKILTVKELRSFTDEVIQARDLADTWYGKLQAAALEGRAQLTEKINECANNVKKFGVSIAGKVSHVLEAALFIKSTTNASNLTTMAVKDVLIGGALATEDPIERLVTLLLAR